MSTASLSKWRRLGVGLAAAATAAAAAGIAAAAITATVAPAGATAPTGLPARSPAAATEASRAPQIDIYQSYNAVGRDFLATRNPDEGTPGYAHPRLRFQVWDFPAGQAPAGFHLIYRGYDARGKHFVTRDAKGTAYADATMDGPLGWLADDSATARAHSSTYCEAPDNGENTSDGYGPAAVSLQDTSAGGGSRADEKARDSAAGRYTLIVQRRHGGPPPVPGPRVEHLGHAPC